MANRTWLLALWLVACSGSKDEALDSEDERDGSTGDDAGAGDPDAGVPGSVNQSGSRLRARLATSDDGLGELDGIVDLAFDSACQILPLGDGVLRCVPGLFSANVRYLDAACTQPVLYEVAGVCTGDAASLYYGPIAGTCPQAFQAYRRGAALDVPTELYDLSSGTCTQFTTSAGNAAALELIAPDELVEIALRTTEGTGRLRTQFQEGADGSRFLAGYVDGMLEQACTVQKVGSGYRCVAGTDGYVSPASFADDACTTPIVYTFGACAEVGKYVLEYSFDPDSCETLNIYEVGAPVETEYFMTTECAAGELPPTSQGYARGAEVQPSVFAAVTQVEEGGSRIVSRKLVVEGLPALPENSSLYDKELALACYPRKASDGVVRCLPESFGTLLYLDEACTDPRLAVNLSACSDVPSHVTVLPRDTTNCPADEALVVEVGAPVDAPSLAYVQRGASCELTTESFGAWFQVKDQPAATRFAEITQIVD